jgi:hypothetical protein
VGLRFRVSVREVHKGSASGGREIGKVLHVVKVETSLEHRIFNRIAPAPSQHASGSTVSVFSENTTF